MQNQMDSEKGAVLVAEMDVETHELVVRAAALSGRSVSQFMVDAATKEALRVANSTERVRLTQRGADRMLNQLDNPPPLSPKLLEAALNHREFAHRFRHRKDQTST